MTATIPSAHLFGAALRGDPVDLVDDIAGSRPLAVRRWNDLTSSDRAVIRSCEGETLDVGCGPGRLTAGLAAEGHVALGIDVVPEAVRQTRERGVHALLRDVFETLPGEGRWRTVLLADGNIGIGGDASRLLHRAAALLATGGRVVADLAGPGRQSAVRQVWLSGGGQVSERFPWALVGVDTVGALAAPAGLALSTVHQFEGRWFGVLQKEGRA